MSSAPKTEDYSQQPADETAEEAFQEELATRAADIPVANDQEYDAEELRDLELAIGLLSGVWTQTDVATGGPDKRYMQGALDKQARLAIGRLLRNRKPLDSALRYQLAELFDGVPPHLSFDGAAMARKISFGDRRAGRKNETALKYLHIASEFRLLRESGTAYRDTMDALCEKYGVVETTVKKARRAYPQLFRRGS